VTAFASVVFIVSLTLGLLKIFFAIVGSTVQDRGWIIMTAFFWLGMATWALYLVAA
jgi:hypothetical protein